MDAKNSKLTRAADFATMRSRGCPWLDSDSELELTQALLDLIELPTVGLREHCPPGLRPENV
jgi:hypothetical protein